MNTTVLRQACVDALHSAQGSHGGTITRSQPDPSRVGCRGVWRSQPDGQAATDYDLSIDLHLQPAQPSTGRCDTDRVELESGLTLCVRSPSGHPLEWHGVLDSRGVDVELRLTAVTGRYASDDERFTRTARPVLENAATVLADAILGRYVPGVRSPLPSRTGG